MEGCPDSIFLIRGERDVENVAVAITDPGRELDAVPQRRPGQEEPDERGSKNDERDRTPNQFPPGTHFPLSTTVIFPPTPCAFTLRSYIASAKTGGTTNS